LISEEEKSSKQSAKKTPTILSPRYKQEKTVFTAFSIEKIKS
jgi:hypothetical protein